MKFSYVSQQQYLLDSIDLPLDQPGIFLLTGIESVSLGILTGILGKLFPIPKESIEWENIAALIANYTGDLKLLDGSFPDVVSYVGADPDRHVLFSTVEEEMMIRLNLPFNSEGTVAKYLSAFDLDASFVKRHIATLSGGEKMKVVLAIAFAKPADCYIFHGVIPWLDKKGRDLLLNKILELRKIGPNILFCEHEMECFFPVVDAIYKFDGKTVSKTDTEIFIKDYFHRQKEISVYEDLSNKSVMQPYAVLEFHKIFLQKHPYFEGIKNNILLNEVSFTLISGKTYFFVGDNGVGKSTLAELIFRIFPPEKGEIFFCKKPLKKYSRQELTQLICYLAQFPEQQITFSTIGEYKKEALKNKNTLALSLFEKYLNLDNNFPISMLSFLQLKLLSLLSFINPKTQLIILDEPTWGVDIESQQIILNFLRDIRTQFVVTLLVISHNEFLIRALNGEVMRIEEGNITDVTQTM